jgi:hypothetical protein
VYKSKSFIVSIIALVVFIALYSLISFLLISYSKNKVKIPLDLLSKPSHMIYGKKLNPDTFSFELDEFGEALVLFDLNPFNSDDYSQLELVVQGLSKNYVAKLVWVIKNHNQPNQFELIQPDGSFQINYLSKVATWKGEIAQVGLQIFPHDLGLTLADGKKITLKNLSLNNGSFMRNYKALLSYWLRYDSWTYKSINHLKSDRSLPIYAQPAIFILLWLAFSLFIVSLFFKWKMVLPLYAMAAWLFIDLLFLSNNHLKKEWVDSIYSSDVKQLPDESLGNLAKQIKSLLNLTDKNIEKIKKIKVLILSSNRYQRARLIFHMLPVNSSFIDVNIEDKVFNKVKTGDFIVSYDNDNRPHKPSAGLLQINSMTIPVEKIAQDKKFIIMRVL